ncbi:putative glycosyl hydrolases family 18 protein [Diplodia seriata]|uniref:chitinase n=1 Tax=Diplodia seriata TaxID=420778 RepID=A0A0G2EHS1_9PEZI|nr:putative glycosyl hydrolases family 18 protein [Diplodia seriata]
MEHATCCIQIVRRFLDYSVKLRRDENAPVCAVNVLIKREDEDYSCSEGKPCSNGACCSKKTGYCNYGPEACGTTGTSPNDVCWSNCDAHAECGRYAEVPGTKCPLNVCCSQFGFCGMTDGFCDVTDDEETSCQSNCDQPGSGGSGGNVQERVIGYYEAWAHDRSCNGMDFEDIPVDALTHLYFSFGYIAPELDVVPMDDLSVDLFSRMTDLKKKNSDLKMVIALGGWTFNDNGTVTQPVFSNMEYPGAGDRGGHEDDGANFVTFLKELNEAIAEDPVDYIVSFTIPTSYWYLRGFDLKAINHADFVNVMSYDLHGIWDSNNPIGSQCTKNSGTLSFREITDIIKQNDLKPYYDKKEAVKYLVWNRDQWVSYDDEETFKQKIDFANKLGLGGLLIWSIDQDTDDLKALQAVLSPKKLDVFKSKSGEASYWQDASAADCYVTDCGVEHCTFLETVADISAIFGGLFGAMLAEKLLEWDLDDKKLFCCPPDEAERWTNCEWKGEPESCFDNHCELNKQVQLATSDYGLGESCFPRLERSRVFCCEPSDGAPLFLPVPLDRLFPDPPDNDDADVDFKLETDNTWGTGKAKTDESDDADEAAFSFYVLTSPDEIQTSLDKRDGSSWELYNCQATDSEEPQTIQMFCTDNSDDSNCNKIHLGHGVPGTIIELPEGCGPGRYAVAKEFSEAEDQELPAHLAKRDYGHKPRIYDLTFDYDFRRVPRDMGNTQMRIDFSNEVGYWDTVVNASASSKRKRSLDDFGGNHRRWLEEEWRDDRHFGGLSHEELHKRWFGDDVLAWLKKMLSPEISPELAHTIDESFTAKMIDKQWNCNIGGVDLEANLLVAATANVKVDTSFGLTIITTLGVKPDMQKSYLYFKNKGEVQAVFTIDALGRASFDSPNWKLAGLDNFPGATLRISGIATIGPNFILYASVDADLVLAGHFEAKTTLATWDVQQTYPDQGSTYEPKGLDAPNPSVGKPSEPEFDLTLNAEGHISAHLRPTFRFGIDFDKWLEVDGCYVDLVAHGYVTLHANATNQDTACPFKYGVVAGAEVYAELDAPDLYGWDLSGQYRIGPKYEKDLIPEKCPESSSASTRRGIDAGFLGTGMDNATALRQLHKRADMVEPSEQLPAKCFVCPSSDPATEGCAAITGWDDDELDPDVTMKKRDLDALDARSASPLSIPADVDTLHFFEKRTPKKINFCVGSGSAIQVVSPDYERSGLFTKTYPNAVSWGPDDLNDCDNMGFEEITTPVVGGTPPTSRFATEHVLEFHLLPKFFDYLKTEAARTGKTYSDPDGGARRVSFCEYVAAWWASGTTFELDVPAVAAGSEFNAMQWTANMFPGKNNDWATEFLILEKYVNGVKERMWDDGVIRKVTKMENFIAERGSAKNKVDEAIAVVKQVIWAQVYHSDPNVASILKKQVDRIAEMLDELDSNVIRSEVGAWLDGSYERLDIAAKWRTWMTSRAAAASKKAETFVTEYIRKIKDAHNAQTPGVRQAILDRIQALETAAAQASWTAPTF